MEYELVCGLELGRHVGQAESDGLMFDNRLAKGLALLRVTERYLISCTGHSYGLRSDANTPAFQIGKCNMITLALSAEPVLLSHAEILETHFTRVGRMLPHLALNENDTITGLPGFNDEAPYASFAAPQVSSSKDQSDVGVLARSDELLCSIE